MHQQIRANPKLSPPDVAALLGRLNAAGVKLVAAGGSNIELEGEFAFAVEHGQERQAEDALQQEPPYLYRVLRVDENPELRLCWVTDRPGESLYDCITGAKTANLDSGRKIRDVLVGPAAAEGIPVHVFSEEDRAQSAS